MHKSLDPAERLTRRSALFRGAGAGAGLLLTSSLLAACGDDGGSGGGTTGGGGGGTLVFTGYGGDFQEFLTQAYLDPFSEQEGVKIVQEQPTDYAKLQLMVEQGNPTWDVVDTGNDFGIGETTRLLEPLDYSLIQRDQIFDGFADSHRVGLMIYSNALVYRTDRLPRAPSGWADVFDLDAFPGKRALDKRVGSSTLLEYALIADGVPVSQLYPLDVRRALAKLDTIRDQTIWFEETDQSQQLFISGEAVVGQIPNGRLSVMNDAKVPVDAVWRQYGMTADFLVIPKGARNVAEAQRLIAFITSAEHNASLSDYIAYAPVNKEALSKVNPRVRRFLPTTYIDGAETFTVDDAWWDANRTRVEDEFTTWLTA